MKLKRRFTRKAALKIMFECIEQYKDSEPIKGMDLSKLKILMEEGVERVYPNPAGRYTFQDYATATLEKITSDQKPMTESELAKLMGTQLFADAPPKWKWAVSVSVNKDALWMVLTILHIAVSLYTAIYLGIAI